MADPIGRKLPLLVFILAAAFCEGKGVGLRRSLGLISVGKGAGLPVFPNLPLLVFNLVAGFCEGVGVVVAESSVR